VRELENLVERLAIFCTSGEIGARDVEQERSVAAPIADSNGNNGNGAAAQHSDAANTLEDMERQHIVRILQEHAGNKSRAARALGIERKTLYQKARRLGIDLQVER
jgi:DNA-binding NtrC family response regulator